MTTIHDKELLPTCSELLHPGLYQPWETHGLVKVTTLHYYSVLLLLIDAPIEYSMWVCLYEDMCYKIKMRDVLYTYLYLEQLDVCALTEGRSKRVKKTVKPRAIVCWYFDTVFGMLQNTTFAEYND